MRDIFVKLADLADDLDRRGYHNLADDIDQLMSDNAEEQEEQEEQGEPPFEKFKLLSGREFSVDIPEYEYNDLIKTFEDLDSSLKEDEESADKERSREE